MSKWVALLRGINVGTAKRIAMADLRTLFTRMGYTDVSTILNSGNIVFSGPGTAAGIARQIEQEIAETFSMRVPTIVVSEKTFRGILKDNPLAQASIDPPKFLVAFVQGTQTLGAARKLLAQSWDPDALAVGKSAAYLWCPSGLLDSSVAKAFGRQAGDSVTTRNWATVLKIQAALG